MRKMPLSQLISVIIPFYSKESGRLISAVTSALNQTNCTVEVVVVDDCSPISAKSELKQINDPRVKIIRHEKNSNGGIARNTGVNNAQGQFIAFLDYDDVWYPNKLELQLACYYMTKGKVKNPVIYSQCKIISDGVEFVRPRRAINKNERVCDYIFTAKEIIQTSGIFLARDLALQVRFDNLKRHQDYQFCLALENFGAEFFMIDTDTYSFIQVPKLNDYHFSKKWLENYSKFMTKKSQIAFKELVILKSIVAHSKYFTAFNYAVHNSLAFKFFKVLIFRVAKLVLPEKIINYFR